MGWRRKLERMEKAGQHQYLEAKETLEKRTEDKLLEKTTWYKGNKKRKMETMTSKYQYNPPSKKRRKGKQHQVHGQKQEDKSKAVKAVFFCRIPTTQSWLPGLEKTSKSYRE